MSEIVKELRTYAAHCRACGEETTANILLHAADWINVQQATITAQKIQMADMRKGDSGHMGKEKEFT